MIGVIIVITIFIFILVVIIIKAQGQGIAVIRDLKSMAVAGALDDFEGGVVGIDGTKISLKQGNYGILLKLFSSSFLILAFLTQIYESDYHQRA